MESVNDVLLLYTWVLTATLLVFFFLIARFYERKAGQRSYYQLFLLPALFYLLSGLRYVMAGGSPWDDLLGNMLLFLGGLTAIGLSYFLFKLMTGGRG